MNNEDIRKELMEMREEKYKEFMERLIPGCNNIIGVRIPKIRKIAKKIVNENIFYDFEKKEEQYYEEIMLKGLVIGNLNEDIDEVLKFAEVHITKITNWSLCDSFCSELKIVRKNKEKVWKFLKKYYTSKEIYEIRVAVVLMLFYFIEEKYLQQIFDICNMIKHEDYYVKMAVAWCLSMCFVKFPKETMRYLEETKLDDDTYNKTLQKIRESLKVDKEIKEITKKMKRK